MEAGAGHRGIWPEADCYNPLRGAEERLRTWAVAGEEEGLGPGHIGTWRAWPRKDGAGQSGL